LCPTVQHLLIEKPKHSRDDDVVMTTAAVASAHKTRVGRVALWNQKSSILNDNR
jgi:hypothetical protein